MFSGPMSKCVLTLKSCVQTHRHVSADKKCMQLTMHKYKHMHVLKACLDGRSHSNVATNFGSIHAHVIFNNQVHMYGVCRIIYLIVLQ